MAKADAKAVDAELAIYRSIEAEQNSILTARQSSIAQLRENEMVSEELKKLSSGAPVFKLVGPVLLKQDLDDAKQNVGKRIEFIQGEIKKAEAKIEENKQKMQSHGEKIMRLQGDLRSKAAEAAQAAFREAERDQPDE